MDTHRSENAACFSCIICISGRLWTQNIFYGHVVVRTSIIGIKSGLLHTWTCSRLIFLWRIWWFALKFSVFCSVCSSPQWYFSWRYTCLRKQSQPGTLDASFKPVWLFSGNWATFSNGLSPPPLTCWQAHCMWFRITTRACKSPNHPYFSSTSCHRSQVCTTLSAPCSF